MAACCGCLRLTGYCKLCACVKAGQPCVDCYPRSVVNCHTCQLHLKFLIFLTPIEKTCLTTLAPSGHPIPCSPPPLPLAHCLPPTFLPFILCLSVYFLLHSPRCLPGQTTPPSLVFPSSPRWQTWLCSGGAMLMGLPSPLKFAPVMKRLFIGEGASSEYLQVKLM